MLGIEGCNNIRIIVIYPHYLIVSTRVIDINMSCCEIYTVNISISCNVGLSHMKPHLKAFIIILFPIMLSCHTFKF